MDGSLLGLILCFAPVVTATGGGLLCAGLSWHACSVVGAVFLLSCCWGCCADDAASFTTVSSMLPLALEARRFLDGNLDGLEGGIGTKHLECYTEKVFRSLGRARHVYFLEIDKMRWTALETDFPCWGRWLSLKVGRIWECGI